MREIAVNAGVSMSHLHLLFRKHCGTSPIQYMLKLRLEEARELLAITNLSVKEICAAVGFNDMKNFSAAFKRRNKLTPTQYRRLTSG
ncbi:MAG: helix-turn-helix transcriptional regulator [Kiritimatiellaeota bacterium]|nr:helix-turn-helix transcriptional regulator [Kiritimatiellota bacterium]